MDEVADVDGELGFGGQTGEDGSGEVAMPRGGGTGADADTIDEGLGSIGEIVTVARHERPARADSDDGVVDVVEGADDVGSIGSRPCLGVGVLGGFGEAGGGSVDDLEESGRGNWIRFSTGKGRESLGGLAVGGAGTRLVQGSSGVVDLVGLSDDTVSSRGELGRKSQSGTNGNDSRAGPGAIVSDGSSSGEPGVAIGSSVGDMGEGSVLIELVGGEVAGLSRVGSGEVGSSVHWDVEQVEVPGLGG